MAVEVEDAAGARWVTESCPLRFGAGCATRLDPPGVRGVVTRAACDPDASPPCRVRIELLPDADRGTVWSFEPTDRDRTATIGAPDGSWARTITVRVVHRAIPLYSAASGVFACADDGLRPRDGAPTSSVSGGLAVTCDEGRHGPRVCVGPESADAPWPRVWGEIVSCGGSSFLLVRAPDPSLPVRPGDDVALPVAAGPCTDDLGRAWSGVEVADGHLRVASDAEPGAGFCGETAAARRIEVRR